MTHEHPTPNQLQLWQDGRLAEAEGQLIEEHLAKCDGVCTGVLDRILIGELQNLQVTSQEVYSTAPSPEGYEILEEIGRGGMGVVYKARHISLNRLVAVKMLRGGIRDRTALNRFLTEAGIAASIRHVNAVQIYDYGQRNGLPYMVLEYLPGGTLAEALKKTGPLYPREAAILVEKLARGVEAAHIQGVIHRDLKPGNILMDETGEPKVADFGLAKRGEGVGETQTGTVMGTPAYMSPEQAEGAKFIGPATDVWALGVILFELLTGKRPIQGETPGAIVRDLTSKEPLPMRKLVSSLPRKLGTIIGKCLTKEAEGRYQTSGELADELKRFIDGEPIKARPKGLVERTYKWAKRKPTTATAGLVTVVALALFGVSLALWTKYQNAQEQPGIAVNNGTETNRAKAVAVGEKEKAEPTDKPVEEPPKKTSDKSNLIKLLIPPESKRLAILTDSRVGSGGNPNRWSVTANGLEADGDRKESWIWFGDPEWENYRLTFAVEKISGNEGFGVLFRAPSPDEFYLYDLGIHRNTIDALAGYDRGNWYYSPDRPYDDGAIPPNRSTPEPTLRDGNTYKVKVEVNGNKCQCYLDDETVFEHTMKFFPKGRIGFRALARCSVRITDILVQDTNGEILWRGYPRLPGN